MIFYMKHLLKNVASCIDVSGAQIFSEELVSKGPVGEPEEIFVNRFVAPYQTGEAGMVRNPPLKWKNLLRFIAKITLIRPIDK